MIKPCHLEQPTWDYTPDGRDNGYNYHNDWTTSTLMQLLNNGAYYNRTTGIYYNNTIVTSVDFNSNGLTEEAKSMVGDTIWNIGGSSTYNGVTTSMFYERERGTTVFTGRPTEWTGQIGLMYPSDYGYATSGGSNVDRDTCLSTELYSWGSVSDCYNNNWLYDNVDAQWVLTPGSGGSLTVFIVSSGVGTDLANTTHNSVSPTLYLSSNIKIISGTGSSSDPYLLSL